MSVKGIALFPAYEIALYTASFAEKSSLSQATVGSLFFSLLIVVISLSNKEKCTISIGKKIFFDVDSYRSIIIGVTYSCSHTSFAMR